MEETKKIAYCTPEVVDFQWMQSIGACSAGTAEALSCSAGSSAGVNCTGNGNVATAGCAVGSAQN